MSELVETTLDDLKQIKCIAIENEVDVGDGKEIVEKISQVVGA